MRWVVSSQPALPVARDVRGRRAHRSSALAQVRDAPVDVFPEFAPPRVEIQTIALGNSSSQVEELITIPLEEQLAGVEGVAQMRSKSVADLSSIELVFERGADVMQVRQLVQERIAQVTPTLPTWGSPPHMMPPLSATSRVMKIGLTSDELSLIEMSTISYWKIRQRLLRVPGVANVAIWGERLQQQQVQVDPAQARRERRDAGDGDGHHGRRPRCGSARATPMARWWAPEASSRSRAGA